MAAVPPVPAQPVLVDQVWFPGNDYITFHGSESHTERRWLRATQCLPIRELNRRTAQPFRVLFQTIGLHNRGNYCYRNAVLQALFHNPRLREWYFRHNAIEKFPGSGTPCAIKYGNCAACALHHIMKIYWNKYTQGLRANYLIALSRPLEGVQDAINPNRQPSAVMKLSRHFKRGYPDARANPPATDPPPTRTRFPPDPDPLGNQEDAADFLRYLNNFLIENSQILNRPEFNRTKATVHDFTTDFLYGLIGLEREKLYTCTDTGCGGDRKLQDIETILIMPLPEGEQDVTADQLFRTYFANDQEHHTCGNLQCPVGVAAAREGSTPPVAPYEHKIKSAGGILMVQLLIYTTITGGLSRRKTNRVTLTETLDLSDYHYSGRPGSLRYRLAAVVIHRGIGTASINGGHYWTYVRDPREEGKWLRVDDNVVSREVQQHVVLNARGNDVRDEAPYLLFYERIYNTPHHNERVQHMPGLEKYIIKNVAEIQNRENAERDGDIEAVIKWKRSFQAVMLLPENERETRKQELRNLWQSVAETKRRAALKRQVNTVFTDVFGDVRHYTRKPENEWDLHDTRILGDFERLYRRMREDTPLTQTSQIELKLKQSLGIWLNVHPVEDPDGLEVYSDPTDGQNGGHPPDGNARMPDDETPPRPLPRHGRGGGGGGGKERQLNVHVQQRYSTRIMDASDDSIDDEYQARGRSRTSRKRVKYTVQKVHQAPTVSTALQTPTTPGQLADVETSSDTSSSEEEVIPTPDTSSSEEEEIPAPKHVIRSGTSIKRGYTRIRRGPNPRDITKPKSEAGVIKRTESRKSSAVARGTPATSSNPVGYTSIARRSRTRRETHPEATTSISKKKATKSVKRSRDSIQSDKPGCLIA